MTIAETSILDVARPPQVRRQQRGYAQDATSVAAGGAGGCAGLAIEDLPAGGGGTRPNGGADDQSLPPRIHRSTKMTRRIRNLYGDADGRISCRSCSEAIKVGSMIRRVKRSGECWHEQCYMQAMNAGRLPPKIRFTRVMTARTRKLFGGGDDGSVLCQMCGGEIGIGMRLRRASGTRACWHEQCYRMTWTECLHRAAKPARPACGISEAKWRRMRSECMKCAGSRLCDYHRRMEAEMRVPRDGGGTEAATADAAASA